MNPFTEQDLHDIRELFGAPPEQLDAEAFRAKLRELRAKYHPDNFEKFDDPVVRQLATDRFQRIERLAEKLERHGIGKAIAAPGEHPPAPRKPEDLNWAHPSAQFAYQAMKIELRTSDKDLKYHLFGTFYRWLTLGERFKIPEAKGAYLIADEDHRGRQIGFTESIRVYLTFEETDPLETIVAWFYNNIAGRADLLLIEGEIVQIDYAAMLETFKRRSFKSLAATAE